ncbi:MAG TPA: GGDEF domain-containing protein, partial [bacterium]|nr:GGDEF domain-containing protein [bacterium]
GMPSAECNGGSKPSMIKTADGIIWIPTVKGVVGIDPDKTADNSIVPSVTFTWLVVDNDFTKKTRIYDTDYVALPKGSREVEIHYSAPVFKESSRIIFSYYLDNTCIVKSTKRRFATFNNLNPGEHKFKVRAFYEGESEENFSESSLVLNIEPFFYETERFRSIFLAISFISIFLAFLMNKRSALIKEEEMRNIINSKTFKLELANNGLQEAVMKDPLTGLRNRRYLYEVEEESINEFIDMNALTREKSSKAVFALIMIDIDHFKRVNDYFGHTTGDLVLVDFANILKEKTRADDVVIRWGGEEFLVLLKGTTREEAVSIAENIRKGVEKHSFSTDDGKEIWLTCSIGLSLIPFFRKSPDFLSFDNIVSITDMALYYSKSTGRDRGTYVNSGTSLPLNQEQFQDMLISYDYAELNGFYKFEIIEKKNFEEFEI